MTSSTCVDLHCHSNFSDGELSPEEVAGRLSAAGVTVAALTDHDTLEGYESFRTALARLGIECVSGVEITAQRDGMPLHLLAYGVDPAHPRLVDSLRALRQARAAELHSIADSIRVRGTNLARSDAETGRSVAPDGVIGVAEAIALVHDAGGKVFLAHPLVLRLDPAGMDDLVTELKAQGLDGIESYYAPYCVEDRERLGALARRHGLLVSAGADQHERAAPQYGVDMPTSDWKTFRNQVCFGGNPPAPESDPALPAQALHRLKMRHFAFHIIFPTLLSIGLFVAAIFAFFLPTFERSLLDRKREMIRELTNSASSILAEYQREERAGTYTRAEAQQLALRRVESLRYGREGKDYFWIQDMHPRILMHPYRQDLNGRDVSDFIDPRGVRIFAEFADLVRRRNEGYLEYVWQWNDDPRRLVPKESYIKGFEPWGWVIGTGIYIEDVNEEISRIERRVVIISLAITVVAALLLFYVVQQSLRLERERSGAERSVRESTERYRSLVEAATEGTLLVQEGRCRYANPTLLELLKCAPHDLRLLDLADILPREDENRAAWEAVGRLLRGEAVTGGFEGVLLRRDGAMVECALSVSPISFAEKSGFILMARNAMAGRAGGVEDADPERQRRLALLADAAGVGLFRARATRRGPILDANRRALRILADALPHRDAASYTLADLFPDAAEGDEFFRLLQRDGSIEHRLIRLSTADARTHAVELSARIVPDEEGEPRFIEGWIDDATQRAGRESEREAMVEKLQTSLLFLHESVSHIAREPVTCPIDLPVWKVAALMTARGESVVLVQSDGGEVLGIVTDHALRERVLALRADPAMPIHRVMSAPLATIHEGAPVFEALLTMQEKGIHHLAVEDAAGRVVGIVRGKDLLQFQNYGPVVLAREIGRAATDEDLFRACRRAPALAKAQLDCGAHPHSVARMNTSICDAATERLAAMAEAELGPPPVPYCLLALGSQGRLEQTLLTDQDNAIIYASPATDEARATAERYFEALGAAVCGRLEVAGYALCRGNVMASNPRWRMSLPAWKACFDDWILKAEPQELLEFSIFFDFRPVHGDARLARELRAHIHQSVRESPAFFPHLAQNALLFKPPMRIFGKILLGGEQTGQLNLKEAMTPIVNFARLYALRHGVNETSTLGRLEALAELGAIGKSSLEETSAAYNLLMRLRLRRQADALEAGEPPANTIDPRSLSQTDETLLKQAFAQIAAVQQKISTDFLGGTA